MIKFKNKSLGVLLLGTLSFSYISGTMTTLQNPKEVYATSYPAEAATINAFAKVDHLISSLKANYLGVKNQVTWQLYIKQARELVGKITNLSAKADATLQVNKAEALVNAIARVNHVEKSMAPKSEGGYGNYLGMKNVSQWQEYIKIAEIDLERVDKNIFSEQYDELQNRKKVVQAKIQLIIDSSKNLDKPSTLKVSFNDKSINAILGTNSWNNVQSDYPGPEELVKRSNPLTVSPKSILTLSFENYPSNIKVNILRDKKEMKQEVTDYKIIVPELKRKVIYEVIATWKQGTVHYAFEVNVK